MKMLILYFTLKTLIAKVDFLDVRPPTRIAGATTALQVIVFLKVSACTCVLRASGLDCIFVRQFVESDQDRAIYKALLMPVGATSAACIGQAQFRCENNALLPTTFKAV